jgi:plastocyanin
MSILSARLLPATALSLSLLASLAPAQQFQYQAGLIPGTARWTEGLESADVDNDGDLDVFFAEGEGFTSAGTKRQNTLVINQFIENGSLSFTNESVARLGTHLSNAKGVATGDIDGDGWVDAVFANAFNTDRPFLYVNQGAGNPGFFNEQGLARGLSEVINSASAGFGDLDDDGDLDLVINDSGSAFLGGAGDKPLLYINDGSGNFTEKTGSGWNPPAKNSQMDVQLVDVDNDWDLDFVGYCRGSNGGGNHYLMLNDGSANFTDFSSTLPNGSSSCYETEIGDLDGDDDLDHFMVSLSGFAEGVVRNNWIESGQTSLTYTALAGLSISQDDNEIALCDYDDDGDLDAFVASLGSKERIWKNNGGLSFAGDHTNIQTVSDSSLDCTFADLDNDGDYDFITAQGESNTAQWVNKVYINSGPADSRAPTLTGEVAVAVLDTDFGPWVAHAKVQDAVVDDGVNFVSGAAHFCINTNAVQNVTINAGSFSPSNLNVACGDTVRFLNNSGGNEAVKSTTLPWTYDSGTLPIGGSWEHTFVRSGVYTFTNTNGAFSGTVTVTGSSSSVAATYSGGGLYRFSMTGDASAAGAELAYELAFTDWAGNVRVSEAHSVDKGAGVGTPFCFGDGSGTACPCSNGGAAGRGCGNSASASGGLLVASGSPTVGADTLVLSASACPPNKPGIFFSGNSQVAGSAGQTFGDGLLCVEVGIKRLEIVFLDGAGDAQSSISLSVAGSVGAGQSRNYQYWFRDPSGGPCGNLFNTTNALQVLWN